MSSFLTLFTTQLKNQDPTNPMESYELSSQLAQFSTVEQLTQSNTLLQTLQNYTNSLNNATMSSLVGKTVTADKSSLEVTSSSVGDASYKLDSAATDVTVKIYDDSGNLLKTIDKGSEAAGSYTIGWDGTNTSNTKVSTGTYTCKITATDSSGTTSSITPTVQGKVYACKMVDGAPYLILDSDSGSKVAVSDVVQVADGSK